MRVKLLTTWFGKPPPWYDQFTAQWSRFALVDFEMIPLAHVRQRNVNGQLDWLNDTVGAVAGVTCRKTDRSLCDLRPAFGHAFKDLYADYDWWGWCDADLVFGDLDRLLPPLLEGCDVLHFKEAKLSGCFALFRNCAETRRLYRNGDYQRVFADPRYHTWDEDEYHYLPGESFYRHVLASGLRVRAREDLMLYDAPEWGPRVYDTPVTARLKNGRLLHDHGEAIFYHFMTKAWPFHCDGRSRFA